MIKKNSCLAPHKGHTKKLIEMSLFYVICVLIHDLID